MADPVGILVFLISSLAFLGLTVLLVRGWSRKGPGGWLIAAAIVTVLWGGVSALNYSWPDLLPTFVVPIAGVLRSVVWIAVLGRFLIGLRRTAGTSQGWIYVTVGVATLAGMALLIEYLPLLAAGLLAPFDQATQVSGTLLAHLVLAVTGLSMVENLYRNASPTNKWGLQLFCLGVGSLFLFDVILYADALLFRVVDAQLVIARGAISILVVPLIAVSAARNPTWKLDVFVSRGIVFHTVSLVGAGAYLILMSAAGYYFREKGGDWGTLIQTTFVFAAGLALTVVLLSGRFRAQLRVFLNKHFFNYNYDYREEWLKVLTTISTLKDEIPLQERVIKAVCDVVDSPGGQLWLEGENDTYRLANRWNFRAARDGIEPKASLLVGQMAEHNWIVEFDQLRERQDIKTGITAPLWALEDDRCWVGVPLIHRSSMIGFLVLQRPRTSHDLGWEDYDILRTVGQQVASYLAEEFSAAALAETRQFDTFNRRFAFVMHDLKNLVSQLSLITRNAERHQDNPEFQQDMLATVQESVRKMKILLERMNEQSERTVRAEDFELNALLRAIVDGHVEAGANMSLVQSGRGIWVTGERERVGSMFRHLIQNGIDAINEDGQVKIGIELAEDMALVAIKDDGCGMDETFLRDELFKPFRSTKASGYGIGAFESRQIVTEHNGTVEVESVPGEGTTFSVRLPVSRRSMEQSGEPTPSKPTAEVVEPV